MVSGHAPRGDGDQEARLPALSPAPSEDDEAAAPNAENAAPPADDATAVSCEDRSPPPAYRVLDEGSADARPPVRPPAPGEALRLARKRAAEEPAGGADAKLLRRRVTCEDLQGLEHRELIALEMLCSRSSLSMRRADAEDRSPLSMRRADAEDRPPPLASC